MWSSDVRISLKIYTIMSKEMHWTIDCVSYIIDKQEERDVSQDVALEDAVMDGEWVPLVD
jgi:hypothetical protein